MCEPATLALVGTGLAAQFGGTMMNAEAAGADAAARNRALQQARFEQANFDRESDGITNRQRDRYANTNGQMTDRAQSVADAYRSNSSATPSEGVTTGAIPASSSNITLQEGKKQGDKVEAFNTQQGQALANLRSFGDVIGETGRGISRDRGDLGMIGGFRQGSANLTPLFLDAATHAGDGQRQLGDIFKGVGQIATTAGLSGGGSTISNLFKPEFAGTADGALQYGSPGFAGSLNYGGPR